jgi:hypothetical protein
MWEGPVSQKRSWLMTAPAKVIGLLQHNDLQGSGSLLSGSSAGIDRWGETDLLSVLHDLTG